MIDNRLNSEAAARIWETVAEFLERKGCNDEQHRDSYILYLYASGMGMKEIAERLGLGRERVRQILVREVDGMTNAARMDGYFALQERYDQLKKEYDFLLQQFELLQNAVKKNNSDLASLGKIQAEALNAGIVAMEIPVLLRRKLHNAGYTNIEQIVLEDANSLMDGRVITPTDIRKIARALSKHGLKLGMTSQYVAKIRESYANKILSEQHPQLL